MNILFWIVSPLLVGMIGLAAFTSILTAIPFLICFSIFVFFGNRFYWKHHQSEVYDSKLTDEQIERATERYISEVIHKRQSGE